MSLICFHTSMNCLKLYLLLPDFSGSTLMPWLQQWYSQTLILWICWWWVDKILAIIPRDQPKGVLFLFHHFWKAQKLSQNVSAFQLLSADRGAAERLSFCRMACLYLPKLLFLQKAESFCQTKPLSAETNLLLPLTAFGRNFLLSEYFLSVTAVTVLVDL